MKLSELVVYNLHGLACLADEMLDDGICASATPTATVSISLMVPSNTASETPLNTPWVTTTKTASITASVTQSKLSATSSARVTAELSQMPSFTATCTPSSSFLVIGSITGPMLSVTMSVQVTTESSQTRAFPLQSYTATCAVTASKVEYEEILPTTGATLVRGTIEPGKLSQTQVTILPSYAAAASVLALESVKVVPPWTAAQSPTHTVNPLSALESDKGMSTAEPTFSAKFTTLSTVPSTKPLNSLEIFTMSVSPSEQILAAQASLDISPSASDAVTVSASALSSKQNHDALGHSVTEKRADMFSTTASIAVVAITASLLALACVYIVYQRRRNQRNAQLSNTIKERYALELGLKRSKTGVECAQEVMSMGERVTIGLDRWKKLLRIR